MITTLIKKENPVKYKYYAITKDKECKKGLVECNTVVCNIALDENFITFYVGEGGEYVSTWLEDDEVFEDVFMPVPELDALHNKREENKLIIKKIKTFIEDYELVNQVVLLLMIVYFFILFIGTSLCVYFKSFDVKFFSVFGGLFLLTTIAKIVLHTKESRMKKRIDDIEQDDEKAFKDKIQELGLKE